jgi:enoyl-[acyl-carrier protein] reductase II
VVGSVQHAIAAESHGVDAVIAAGSESAAHGGFDELPLFSLIPQIVDAVSIPVIAAGGIADGRGMAAAFALGAEGVQLGTRFVAVDECLAHPRYKQAIREADDTGTVVTCRKLLPTRSLKTPFSKRLLDLENSGASAEEVYQFLGYSRARRGQLEGNLDEGEAYAGSSVGLINEMVSVAEVVQDLINGYKKAVKNLIREYIQNES